MSKKKKVENPNQLFMDFNKKKIEWTVESIRSLLIRSETWRIKAFFKIWAKTVRGEKDMMGFNRYDYENAEKYWKEFKSFGEFTPNAKHWILNIIPKYSPQLYRMRHCS